MSRSFRLTTVISALLSLAFIVSLAYAYSPPDFTKTFYGDATGDMLLQVDDIPAHKQYAASGAATYNTTQPQVATQYWNTCDMTGDNLCQVDDIPSLKQVAAGNTISVLLASWHIDNWNLPLSGNASGSFIPFQLNVQATGGAVVGRPGMIMKVKIDPTGSTTTGLLQGRSCASGDLHEAGATCAIGVSVTDMAISTNSNALTESASSTTLQIEAASSGTIHLHVEIISQPLFQIPAMTLDLYPVFTGGDAIAIDCSNPGPNPVNEGSAMQCTVTASSAPEVSGDNCGGAINGTGPWTYDFTPTEAQGPGSCTAGVRLISNTTVTDNGEVVINEVNQTPTWQTAPTDISLSVNSAYNATDGTATDADLPNASAGNPGYLTCSTTANTCSGITFTVTGAGAPPRTCNVAFTASATVQACTLTIHATDGLGLFATSTINVNVTNTAPVNNAPTTTVSGNELTAISFSTSPTDVDRPAQTLTSSVVSATGACTNGAFVGNTWSWTPTEAQGPTTCSVLSRVYDGIAYSNQVRTPIQVNEVNQTPTWQTAPTDISLSVNSAYNATDGTATDADLPNASAGNPGYLTCSTTANTCSGITFTVTGAGAPPRTCNVAFTASATVQACTLTIHATDGLGLFATSTINVNVTNTAPVNNAPTTTVSGNELTAISFSTSPTDVDRPAQTLTSSVVSATGACTNGAFVGNTWSWTPTEAQGPTTCSVLSRVYDGIAYSNQVRTPIQVNEVNQTPTWQTAPTDISLSVNSAYNATDGTATDADLPNASAGNPGYLTCSTTANTCSGITFTVTGAGAPPRTCNVAFTASATVQACTLTIHATDGLGLFATSTINVNVTNTAPVNNAPTTTVSGNELTAISFSTSPTDVDRPAQTLTSSVVSATGACTNGAFVGNTWSWTPTEAQGPTTCSVLSRVYDGIAYSNQVRTPIQVNEVNVAPTWTTAPVDISVHSTSAYSATNGVAGDTDLPNASAGNPGYVTCSTTGNTCSGITFTVSGSGAGAASCAVSFPSGQTAQTCTVTLRATDGPGLYVSSTVNVTIIGGTNTWNSTGPSATVEGGVEVGGVVTIPRVANNYPPDWAKVTLHFTSTITACGGSVVCGTTNQAGSWAVSSSNWCTFTASAGYLTSNASCVISKATSTPACTNCTGKTASFKTALRPSECSPLGGTCGGFIDRADYYGTATTSVSVTVVKKEDFTAVTGSGSYLPYMLFEQLYTQGPSSVSRTERFSSTGVFTLTPPIAGPAKITVSYKGSTEGSCSKAIPSVTRDCYQTATYIDVDARKVVIPLELTSTENVSLPIYYLRGDVGIATFNSMINSPPPNPSSSYNGFPNPLRIGFVSPMYVNKSMAELGMSTIFQPDQTGRTLTICYGNAGKYTIQIGAKLMYNLVIPDLVRSAVTNCNNGYTSGTNTTWRFYVNAPVNTGIKVMLLGGLANDSLYNLDKGLDIKAFPIFLKAFGDYTFTMPATTYTDGTFYSTTPSTPFEIDYRDRYFGTTGGGTYDFGNNNHLAEGGYTSGTSYGRTILMTMPRVLINDPARVAMGTSPVDGNNRPYPTLPYGDPNRWEQANWATGGSFVKLGPLLALGGRVPGVGASDPGGIVAVQLHMTNKVDDSRFTFFKRAGAVVGNARPTYTDRNPWSGTTTNTGVVSEFATGIPSTRTGDIMWSEVQDAMTANLWRPAVSSWAEGGVAVTTSIEGSSLRNTILGDLVDGTTKATTEFLNMPTVVSPTANGYYIPTRTGIKPWTGSVDIPINRDGQIWAGTAGKRAATTTTDDRLQKKAGTNGWLYFTLNSPAMNIDSTRRADFFMMYIADGNSVVDSRTNRKESGSMHNRFWKFYGNTGGKNGAATYDFTIPYIVVGSRAINGTTAYVPRPFMGNGNNITLKTMQWDYTNVIIGTSSSEAAVTPLFDYQNQNFNWFNYGMTYSASDTKQFIWNW